MELEDFEGPEGGYVVAAWIAAAGRWVFRPVMGGPLLTDNEIKTLGLDAPLAGEPDPLPPWTDARTVLPVNKTPDGSALLAQRGGWWKRTLADIDWTFLI